VTTVDPKLRVLVIDDDVDVATVMGRLMNECGCESYVCVHPKDSMSKVEELRPDVVLLDLCMPGMTGFDIAREIQHNPDLRPLRLVAVTGNCTEPDRQQTSATGFDAHLQKPVNFAA